MKNGILGSGRLPVPIGSLHHDRNRRVVSFGNLSSNSASQRHTPFVNSVREGKTPDVDGEINTYITTPYQWNLLVEKFGKIERRVGSRQARSNQNPVLFVNGIKGSGKKFRQQALMTSAFSGGPVEGVFNKSEGMPKDFLQCINDKRTSSEFMRVKAKIGGLVDSLADAVGLAENRSVAKSWVEDSISDNLATLSLFRKLLNPSYGSATIVAHSQGNIITANAMNAVAALLGPSAIQRMRVISVGSPVVFWSAVKNVHSFGFKNDAVVLFSLSIGKEAAYAGGSFYEGLASIEDIDTEEPTELRNSFSPFDQLTHTFFLYVAHYWDELVSLFP